MNNLCDFNIIENSVLRKYDSKSGELLEVINIEDGKIKEIVFEKERLNHGFNECSN